MRISPTPWSLRGTEILDQQGNVIGAFRDWRDAEEVVEDFKECGGQSRAVLLEELHEAELGVKVCTSAMDKALGIVNHIIRDGEFNTKQLEKIATLLET